MQKLTDLLSAGDYWTLVGFSYAVAAVILGVCGVQSVRALRRAGKAWEKLQ